MAKTNWGAGLSALGQGLAGLADMQWQRQEQERQRQMQLADVEAQRAFLTAQEADRRKYDAEMWDKRNPVVDLPSQTTAVPFLAMPGIPAGPQQVPNPQRQPWMGNLSQMPQDTYTQLTGQFAMDQMNADQAAAAAAAAGQPTGRDQFGRETDIILQAMRDKALRDRMIAEFEWKRDNAPPEPNGGYSATELKMTVQRAITPDERMIWGDRWAQDTELAVADLLSRGAPMSPQTIAEAKEAAKQMTPGLTPNLSFGLAHSDVGGGTFYNPNLQEEVVTQEPRNGLLGIGRRDKIVEIMPKVGLAGKDKTDALAPTLADTTFIDKYLKPAVERKTIKRDDLKAAIDLGLDKEELERRLGLTMQAAPDSAAAAITEGF